MALSYTETYLQTKDTHAWYHVMVRLAAFPSFIRALRNSSAKVLRFSCWCNGGIYEAERHRHHRHLILTLPKESFEVFWKEVTLEDPDDKPSRRFPCKMEKPIQSPLHFVNTLGYLSHRKSRCQFSFREEEREQGDLFYHHFYTFQSLPLDYKLILV